MPYSQSQEAAPPTSFRAVLTVAYHFIFLYLIVSLFHLHSLDIELCIISSFLAALKKKCLPLLSLLMVSDEKFLILWIVLPLYFPSIHFQYFFFVFYFQTFDVSGCWFIGVYPFRVCSYSWIGTFMSFVKFRIFPAIISSSILCVLQSFSCLRTPVNGVRSFVIVL